MRVIPTRLPEVKIIEPRVFPDERGFFFESYNHRALAAEAHVPRRLAQRVTYTLARCGALRAAGVVGRERLYALSDQAPQPSAPTVRSGAEDGRAPRESAPGRD